MKLEDLTNLGISKDVAKKVQALEKEDIDGNYVPKDTFDAERQKVKDRDETIADRDKQIKELGTFKGDAEALKTKVEELTSDNETAKKEYDEKIAKLEIETAIQLAVADKVYNVGDILPKLDTSKLTINEGKIIAGLNEQLEAIQKDMPHYFKTQSDDANNNHGLPAGWSPFGNTPAEGKGGKSGNSAEDFGKSLAKSQVQHNAFTQKASETYFQ